MTMAQRTLELRGWGGASGGLIQDYTSRDYYPAPFKQISHLCTFKRLQFGRSTTIADTYCLETILQLLLSANECHESGVPAGGRCIKDNTQRTAVTVTQNRRATVSYDSTTVTVFSPERLPDHKCDMFTVTALFHTFSLSLLHR